jgi:hypothetical protein
MHRHAIRKEISPDDRRRIFSDAEPGRTDFVKVGSERDVRIVESRDLRLPIYAPNGLFHHQELASAAIPLELDTAHPNERYSFEELSKRLTPQKVFSVRI